MKIGVIGTGNMGKALGRGWTRRGHEVLFGSRDLAKATQVAMEAGPSARGGSFDEAAAFGEVVLYTLRDVPPTKLLKNAKDLDGKIVIDCNNSDLLDPKRATFPLARPGHTIAEQIAANIPRARVVKAFNTHPAQVLGVGAEILRAERISAFIAGDDESARQTIATLAEDLGLTAIDSGGLDRAYLVEGLADFLRFQIAGKGLGTYATLSLRIVDPEAGHV